MTSSDEIYGGLKMAQAACCGALDQDLADGEETEWLPLPLRDLLRSLCLIAGAAIRAFDEPEMESFLPQHPEIATALDVLARSIEGSAHAAIEALDFMPSDQRSASVTEGLAEIFTAVGFLGAAVHGAMGGLGLGTVRYTEPSTLG